MKNLLKICFIILSVTLIEVVTGQNLIPNGSFESGDLPCDNPDIRDEEFLEYWYDIYGGLKYVRQECQNNNSIGQTNAHSGVGYISMGGNVQVNGVISSTFLGSNLKETLEANATYYITLYGRSGGITHPSEEDMQDCVLDPLKIITFYVGDENEVFGAEYTAGVHLLEEVRLLEPYQTISFGRPVLIQSNPTGWINYSTCFEANGDESQIGFSGPLGKSNVLPPCETFTDAELDTFSVDVFNINRYFHFFSFDVDDIGLYKLPDQLEAQDSICRFQNNVVDVRKYLPEIPVWEDAVFEWQDGDKTPLKELNDIGTFSINIILDCKTIPLKLELFDAHCPSHIYVPNVFSPNNDGNNDLFCPIFNQVYEVEYLDVEIFDRWGSKVFKASSFDCGWDGTFKGHKVEQGTYIWKVMYKLRGFSRVENISGSILLIR